LEKINKYSNYIFRISLLLIIIFISSDIFLTIEFSGATVRFSNIIFLFLFILWAVYLIFTKKYAMPVDRSFTPLFLFCFISLVSSLNSLFPLKSLVYSLWTIFSALTIVFLVWFVRNNKLSNLNWILNIYFYSFFVISIFGIYQILLPFLIGRNTPFVIQWWQQYRIARINGLSYEPSYFATYLLMGCFIWFFLWLRNNESVRYKGIILIVLSGVVILSSSRIGWIGIILMIAYGLVEFIVHFIINKKFTFQSIKFFISFALLIMFSVVTFLVIITHQDTFQFLFKGTGLFGTTEYTYSIRNDRTAETIKVFLDKPVNTVIGVGPGGVGAYINRDPENFEKLWTTEPSNITAELLASVGIVGFLIFSWFIWNVFSRLWKLYKNNDIIKKYRSICLALFAGLFIELLMLQFNQNYMRPYLWLHIGICIATVNVIEHLLKNNREQVCITGDEDK
jgi:hypothetical protein